MVSMKIYPQRLFSNRDKRGKLITPGRHFFSAFILTILSGVIFLASYPPGKNVLPREKLVERTGTVTSITTTIRANSEGEIDLLLDSYEKKITIKGDKKKIKEVSSQVNKGDSAALKTSPAGTVYILSVKGNRLITYNDSLERLTRSAQQRVNLSGLFGFFALFSAFRGFLAKRSQRKDPELWEEERVEKASPKTAVAYHKSSILLWLVAGLFFVVGANNDPNINPIAYESLESRTAPIESIIKVQRGRSSSAIEIKLKNNPSTFEFRDDHVAQTKLLQRLNSGDMITIKYKDIRIFEIGSQEEILHTFQESNNKEKEKYQNVRIAAAFVALLAFIQNLRGLWVWYRDKDTMYVDLNKLHRQ